MTSGDIAYPTPKFDLAEYRLRRNRRLERENEHLRAERLRLERLLAVALRVAVGKHDITPLLEGIATLLGTNLARPAWVEHRDRATAEARLERVVAVLQETA